MCLAKSLARYRISALVPKAFSAQRLWYRQHILLLAGAEETNQALFGPKDRPDSPGYPADAYSIEAPHLGSAFKWPPAGPVRTEMEGQSTLDVLPTAPL